MFIFYFCDFGFYNKLFQDLIVQYYYNITMETSKWIEALLLGSTILSWSWSLSEWIQQRGVVLLQSAPVLGVPGVAALYPRLVCPQPPHDGVQPLLPALRLLRLLQVQAARQEPLRAAAVAGAQALGQYALQYFKDKRFVSTKFPNILRKPCRLCSTKFH